MFTYSLVCSFFFCHWVFRFTGPGDDLGTDMQHRSLAVTKPKTSLQLCSFNYQSRNHTFVSYELLAKSQQLIPMQLYKIACSAIRIRAEQTECMTWADAWMYGLYDFLFFFLLPPVVSEFIGEDIQSYQSSAHLSNQPNWALNSSRPQFDVQHLF